MSVYSAHTTVIWPPGVGVCCYLGQRSGQGHRGTNKRNHSLNTCKYIDYLHLHQEQINQGYYMFNIIWKWFHFCSHFATSVLLKVKNMKMCTLQSYGCIQWALCIRDQTPSREPSRPLFIHNSYLISLTSLSQLQGEKAQAPRCLSSHTSCSTSPC